MRTALLIAIMALTACGQHVFDQNGTKIKIGSKLYRGHTYKTTYTPPENCILVTRVSYGRRLDNGRHGGSVTVPLPVTLPEHVSLCLDSCWLLLPAQQDADLGSGYLAPSLLILV